jgi:DNA-binding transcriptional MerR regulator
VPTDAYSITDLAHLTGLSVRTIRYYLAQGLIPASGESGPGAHYGEGHLGRLRLVRRLQQQHLPLAEIRARLADLTDADVTDLAGEPAATPPEADTSALDYVRAVLAGSSGIADARPALPAQPAASSPSAATLAPAAGLPAMRDTPLRARSLLSRFAMPHASEQAAPHRDDAQPLAAEPVTPEDPAPPSIERSQWERLSLGPNLELHVRRPLGRLEQKRVERLITIARQVLKEEQP